MTAATTPATTSATTPESAPHHPEVFINPRARAWQAPEGHDGALHFHRSLRGYAPTPLTELPHLAAELGVGRVFVKDETERLGLPAFKVLGASWAVHRALQTHSAAETEAVEAQAAGRALVTASDGNHGRALARTGRLLGHPARVYLPRGVHPVAAAAITDEGADVVEVDGDYDEAVAQAAQDAQRTGALLVQDTAWPGYEQIPAWIVGGYATLTREIDDALAAAGLRADLVAVPVGVGSLAQAVIEHYRRPGRGDDRPGLLGVEPTAAAGLLASLRAGEIRSVATGTTTMAGFNCGTPSSAAWPALRGGLDAAVAVTDAQAGAAARELRAAGIDVGPCGAATLAGLRSLRAAASSPADSALAAVGAGPDSVVVLLATEGRAANPAGDDTDSDPTPEPDPSPAPDAQI